MSVRQQIVDAIKTRLQQILLGNGYQTDVGKHVFRHEPMMIDDDDLPALIYRATTGDSRAVTGYHMHTLELEIVAVMDGRASDDTVREIMADVLKAIGTDPTWGGLAINTTPRGNDIQTDPANGKITASVQRFAIAYRTAEWAI